MSATNGSGEVNTSREYAESLDAQDSLKHIREEFIIPSKSDLKSTTLPEYRATTPNVAESEQCIYLCGNSLGIQPRRISQRLQQYLTTWATQGVLGHFKSLDDSPLPAWINQDEKAAEMMAPIVGANPSEIAVMATLTANIHFLLCAFYKPDINGRHKIIIESKAFPSDHYAVESQIRFHGLDTAKSMVCIDPIADSPTFPLLGTHYILFIIDQHADDTAILLLPGIQFYSGELFDIKAITAYAQSKGIFVMWDLAHAAGNVPLQLHDWNVDAAAWCSYKYINAGPGAIGGLFVHERNSKPLEDGTHRNRLSGWWGGDKKTRFQMNNTFEPISGAGGFQMSNPSTVDLTSLCGSLEVYHLTTMQALREKSLKLTKYLEDLLIDLQKKGGQFKILTPLDPERRGAQLSLKLEEGLLAVVMHELEARAVILDERKPDVIRVAPAPLYNNFTDVWKFMEAFKAALDIAAKAKAGKTSAKGTDELLQTS